jgi:hypothetical protein
LRHVEAALPSGEFLLVERAFGEGRNIGCKSG